MLGLRSQHGVSTGLLEFVPVLRTTHPATMGSSNKTDSTAPAGRWVPCVLAHSASGRGRGRRPLRPSRGRTAHGSGDAGPGFTVLRLEGLHRRVDGRVHRTDGHIRRDYIVLVRIRRAVGKPQAHRVLCRHIVYPNSPRPTPSRPCGRGPAQCQARRERNRSPGSGSSGRHRPVTNAIAATEAKSPAAARQASRGAYFLDFSLPDSIGSVCARPRLHARYPDSGMSVA